MGSSLRIALYTLRQWRYDARIPVLCAVMLAVIMSALAPLSDFCRGVGYASTPAVFPFVFGMETYQFIFALGALFLFSDAPFYKESHLFVVVRTGKGKWIRGQILYVFMGSFLYVAMVMGLTALAIAPTATLFADGWGSVASTMAYTNAGDTIRLSFAFSEKIIGYMPVVQAMGLSFLLEWIAVSILGLLMLASGIALPHRIGLLAGGLLCFLDVFVANLLPYFYLHFSPFSMARLKVLDYSGGASVYPTPEWAIAYGVVWLAALCAISIAAARRFSVESSYALPAK